MTEPVEQQRMAALTAYAALSRTASRCAADAFDINPRRVCAWWDRAKLASCLVGAVKGTRTSGRWSEGVGIRSGNRRHDSGLVSVGLCRPV